MVIEPHIYKVMQGRSTGKYRIKFRGKHEFFETIEKAREFVRAQKEQWGKLSDTY